MVSFLLIFSSYIISIFGQCLHDQVKGPNGVCYKPYNIRTSWNEAEAECVRNGGHLASVGGGIINGFLDGIADLEFRYEEYWIGSTNLLDGKWSWTDHKEFKFQNWDTGHPATLKRFCLSMHRNDAKWRSSPCDELKPFICEFAMPNKIENSQQIKTKTIVRSICSKNWMYSPPTKKCYLTVSDPNITWPDAEAACKQISPDASLVNIHSLAENTLVSGYAAAATSYKGSALWIGLYRSDNGAYQWIDGSSFKFSHFYLINQPKEMYTYLVLLDDLDNYSDGKSFCMLNRWMCTDGIGVDGYICEKPAVW